MKRQLYLAVTIVLSMLRLNAQQKDFSPGEIWYDTKQQPINAHGGGLLRHQGKYYWFGEIKKGKTWKVPGSNWENYRVVAGGVACYSSTDLVNWTYEGVALPADTNNTKSELHISNVIERPKVIYHAATKKFVMWFHLDSPDYSLARSAVAVSDHVAGPYTYIGSVRPNGNMARDMTVFVDDDKKAYHFYSSEENATMHIALLSDDYQSHTATDKRILIGQSREAPAVFKYNKKYYLLTSGCTGWSPNAASWAVADSILGEWKPVSNPCTGADAEKTFFAQSTFVLPVDPEKGKYIFMADRWNKLNLEDSRYIWLPLQMNAQGVPEIAWQKTWNLSQFRKR
ncbi:glycoside hydrolase family 43 protein [Flavihumibacter petaseus]|uniref:Putative glycosidase n=1 Tax=Flavihumibacter petaseus NBRC 106054 TaxID=1220578 RepID=A0A0E9MYV5_9BACT|nr:glycoside hydrolase family 43 protein [Flavihumibacter petaseus]GAO42295.1 putative glycosidase [Flavihumibacter petaseus NBRC 106054]